MSVRVAPALAARTIPLMNGWKEPDFVEIKMDAEIGSYQEDYGPLVDDTGRVEGSEARPAQAAPSDD